MLQIFVIAEDGNVSRQLWAGAALQCVSHKL